jgi:hypothetical protein
MKRSALVSLFALAMVQSAFVSATSGPLDNGESPTGIYSTFRISPRSGDIVGMEIIVLRGTGALHAVVQASEGAPGTPLIVPLDVKGNDLLFSIPVACSCGLAQGSYAATVSKAGLELRRSGQKEKVLLPRGNSYWQSH